MARYLEPGKDVLNEVARLVHVLVVAARLLAATTWGNDDRVAPPFPGLDQPGLRVVGRVRD